MTEGGTVRTLRDTVAVEGATAATSFREADPEAYAEGHARGVLEKGWEALRSRHRDDYRAQFGTMDLRIGAGEEPALPTDQRLESTPS